MDRHAVPDCCFAGIGSRPYKNNEFLIFSLIFFTVRTGWCKKILRVVHEAENKQLRIFTKQAL
jgi:hypothetical protein